MLMLKAGGSLVRPAVAIQMMAARATSSHGHEDLAKKYNPHGWKSWKDIPDSALPPLLGRDPDNPLYETRHYMNIRKKRIWYQIPDGNPVWLKNKPWDHIAYYGIIIMLSVMSVITFKNFYYLVRYGGFPKKKEE